MPKTKAGRKKSSNHQRGPSSAPKAPPPPPPSLVELIQNNDKVLEYFQSLQANLDYDVDKWKGRAKQFEVESLEWKKKFNQLHKKRSRAESSNKRRKDLERLKRIPPYQHHYPNVRKLPHQLSQPNQKYTSWTWNQVLPQVMKTSHLPLWKIQGQSMSYR